MRVLLLIVAALALAAGGTAYYGKDEPRPLRITFLDVGQGDSAVIQSPGGVTAVVDAGKSFEDGDTGRQIVLPFLRSRGINRIDGLVLTHDDDDHIGGARTLLERIRVLKVLIPLGESEKPGFADIAAVAAKRGVSMVAIGAGQVLDFNDGVTAEVLNPLSPTPYSGEKDNDRSLVLRLRHGRNSVLLTGDAEEVSEYAMCRIFGDLRTDVLKAGHHGSRTSTSARFLNRVQPQVAVISAGRRNSFGHPHPAILNRLSNLNIPALRTDLSGAITVESDGLELQISTQRPVPK